LKYRLFGSGYTLKIYYARRYTMFLLEHQAKSIIKRYGFQVPQGGLVRNPKEAGEVASKFGKVALKIQIPGGGRGKKGGIKFAETPQEAEKLAEELLSKKFNGFPVQELLVEELVTLDKEYYLGVTDSRDTRSPIVIISSRGGIDVEELGEKYPEYIAQEGFSLRFGFRQFQARELARKARIDQSYLVNIGNLVQRLTNLYRDYDTELVEVNPLGVTRDGKLFALDVKMVVDSDALFRHKDLEGTSNEGLSERQRFAEEKRYGYVEFNYYGEIGCAATGAGLGLTSMDLINDIAPNALAFFLDVGGRFVGSTGDVFKLAQMFPNLKAILVNRYGGFGRGQIIAESMIQGLLEVRPKIPVMLSLSGSGEKAAIEHFKQMEEKVLAEGITFEWTSHVATGNETGCARKGSVDVIEYPAKRVLEWAGYKYERRPPNWFPERKDWDKKTRKLIQEAMRKRPEKEYQDLSKAE
jgi:succinyl-CoA synthetase beta subunit